MLHHPYPLTRDTAKYRPLQRAKGRPHSLKYLAKALLSVAIQGGEHDPVHLPIILMLFFFSLFYPVLFCITFFTIISSRTFSSFA